MSVPDFLSLLAHTPRLCSLYPSVLWSQGNQCSFEPLVLGWLSSLALSIEVLDLGYGKHMDSSWSMTSSVSGQRFKHSACVPIMTYFCWILHAPTIRAVACVGAQPLLEDALVHLQDFLEPREPRAHSLLYFSLCALRSCFMLDISVPQHVSLSASGARVHLILDHLSCAPLLFDSF